MSTNQMIYTATAADPGVGLPNVHTTAILTPVSVESPSVDAFSTGAAIVSFPIPSSTVVTPSTKTGGGAIATAAVPETATDSKSDPVVLLVDEVPGLESELDAGVSKRPPLTVHEIELALQRRKKKKHDRKKTKGSTAKQTEPSVPEGQTEISPSDSKSLPSNSDLLGAAPSVPKTSPNVVFPCVGAIILTWDLKAVVLTCTAQQKKWNFPRGTVGTETMSIARDREVFQQTGLKRAEHLHLIWEKDVAESSIDELSALGKPSTRYHVYIWKCQAYSLVELYPPDKHRFSKTEVVLLETARARLSLPTRLMALEAAVSMASRCFVPPSPMPIAWQSSSLSASAASASSSGIPDVLANVCVTQSKTVSLGWQLVARRPMARGTVIFIDQPLAAITGDESEKLKVQWHNCPALFLASKLLARCVTTRVLDDLKLHLKTPLSPTEHKIYKSSIDSLAALHGVLRADVIRMVETVSAYCRQLTGPLSHQPIGYAVFPITAMMNHACRDYNVILFATPTQCNALLMRNVVAGEPLTIAYFAGTGRIPYHVRQATLSALHFHMRSDDVKRQPCMCTDCISERRLSKRDFKHHQATALAGLSLQQFSSGEKPQDEVVATFSSAACSDTLRYFLLFQNMIPMYCSFGLRSMAQKLQLNTRLPPLFDEKTTDRKSAANLTSMSDSKLGVAKPTDVVLPDVKDATIGVKDGGTIDAKGDVTKGGATIDSKGDQTKDAKDSTKEGSKTANVLDAKVDANVDAKVDAKVDSLSEKIQSKMEKEIEIWRATPECRGMQLLTDFLLGGMIHARKRIYHVLSLDEQLLFHFMWNFLCWEASHHHLKATYAQDGLSHPLPESDPLRAIWIRFCRQAEPARSFCISYCGHVSTEMARIDQQRQKNKHRPSTTTSTAAPSVSIGTPTLHATSASVAVHPKMTTASGNVGANSVNTSTSAPTTSTLSAASFSLPPDTAATSVGTDSKQAWKRRSLFSQPKTSSERSTSNLVGDREKWAATWRDRCQSFSRLFHPPDPVMTTCDPQPVATDTRLVSSLPDPTHRIFPDGIVKEAAATVNQPDAYQPVGSSRRTPSLVDNAWPPVVAALPTAVNPVVIPGPVPVVRPRPPLVDNTFSATDHVQASFPEPDPINGTGPSSVRLHPPPAAAAVEMKEMAPLKPTVRARPELIDNSSRFSDRVALERPDDQKHSRTISSTLSTTPATLLPTTTKSNEVIPADAPKEFASDDEIRQTLTLYMSRPRWYDYLLRLSRWHKHVTDTESQVILSDAVRWREMTHTPHVQTNVNAVDAWVENASRRRAVRLAQYELIRPAAPLPEWWEMAAINAKHQSIIECSARCGYCCMPPSPIRAQPVLEHANVVPSITTHLPTVELESKSAPIVATATLSSGAPLVQSTQPARKRRVTISSPAIQNVVPSRGSNTSKPFHIGHTQKPTTRTPTVTPTTTTLAAPLIDVKQNDEWDDEHVLAVAQQLQLSDSGNASSARVIKQLTQGLAKDQAFQEIRKTFADHATFLESTSPIE